jgi:nucleotide-binding universal stress UspA family protein
MIRNVLIALDASERARAVFHMGTELARRFGARVWVVRVIALPQDFPPAAHVAHDDPLPAHLERLALEDLHTFVDRVLDLEVAPPLVRSGQPWRKILEVAEEVDADLIVLGSHGYHGLDRVLGTTAAKVANLAVRHVFVVHNRDLPGKGFAAGGTADP